MRLLGFGLFSQIIRVTLYKGAYFVKQCRSEILQMSANSGIQNCVAALGSYCPGRAYIPWSSEAGSRRVLLAVIAVLALLLYMWPSWLRPGSHTITPNGPLEMCIDAKLQPLENSVEHFDVVMPRKSPEDPYSYLPFIGNGYIGTTVESQGQLFIKNGRVVNLPIKFYPTVAINIEGLPSKESSVINLVQGVVNTIQCFQLDSTCVSVATQSYAHRGRPAILVQEIRIGNPTESPVTIDLDYIGVSDWLGASSETKRMSGKNSVEMSYQLIHGTTPVVGSVDQVVAVVIGVSVPPDTVSVKSGSSWRYHTVTAIRFSEPLPKNQDLTAEFARIKSETEKELQVALNIDGKILRQEHSSLWQRLWMSGFGISRSRAAGALNGDKINSTMYYVLSNTPAPLLEISQPKEKKDQLETLLYFPDRCYGEHHTLQNHKMWADISSIESLGNLVQTWILTLEKHGCASMLQAGADGMLQAMILSVGGLKFSNHHLEFGTHPKDFHRDYQFRRINYGNNTHVNISVIVGEDNRNELYVALDRNDRPYYACDAGCLDPPVKLTKERIQFPVKLTDPLTAVLYITSNKQHMEDLKHVIHVREIVEAPAHEHHVIALHRHGHHYGGLPMIFWISISFLIIIFHLFLFKLIFNEYCNVTDKYSYTRNRYNV